MPCHSDGALSLFYQFDTHAADYQKDGMHQWLQALAI
jgi:hypothetical protein